MRKKLLPHLLTLYERHRGAERSELLPEFLHKAISLVANQIPDMPDDIAALVDFALQLFDRDPNDSKRWSIALYIARLLQRNPLAHRRFYADDIERSRRGEASRIGVYFLLEHEDWQWLRDRAFAEWADAGQPLEDAFWLAGSGREAGTLALAAWNEFVSVVEAGKPGLPDQLEERLREHGRISQQQDDERKRRKQRKAIRPLLVDRVFAVLDQAKGTDADRMRMLGNLCFGDIVGYPGPSHGDWNELPVDLQERVLFACRKALEDSEPTRIPDINQLSSSNLGEGAAITQLVVRHNRLEWLTEGLIDKWLPAALIAGLYGGWADLIRACWAVSPAATERALLWAIPDQSGKFERPFALREIPSECWTQAMTDRLISLIRSCNAAATRIELLEQLAIHHTESAKLIAVDWASRPVAQDGPDSLRQAGRNVLLEVDPATALNLIELDVIERGNAGLDGLTRLRIGVERCVSNGKNGLWFCWSR